MNPRRRVAVAVVGGLGAVLVALSVSGVTSAGGYPVYLALAALVVVVTAALGATVAVFLSVHRWLEGRHAINLPCDVGARPPLASRPYPDECAVC